MKKIWRKNFEIKRTALHMATPAIYDMLVYQPVTVGKMILKEFVWVQKNYDNTGAFAPVEQLRSLIDATIEEIRNHPDKISAIHKKAELLASQFFEFSKKINQVDLAKLSNKELVNIFKKFNYWQEIHHGWALPTTWFVDSDGEDFTKFLQDQLTQILKEQKATFSLPEIFSTLTSSARPSLAMQEEVESLLILKLIKQDNNAKRIFLQKDPQNIESSLRELNPVLRQKIIRHYKKWHWMPYTYIGPVYDLDFYLSGWSGLLRQKFNLDNYLKKIRKYSSETKRAKAIIYKKIKLSTKEKQYFDIASEIVYLKAFRKDALYYGCFVLEKIHKEIAKRLSLSLKQVRFFAHWEIEQALLKNKFSEKTLNERLDFCVYYQNKDKGYIYTGARAKGFIKRLKIEREVIKKVDEFTGTCACPGKKRGRVKIINIPEEMAKMNQGDIMVAHTTFPALVPAMKKAIAIVTDDGGLTCHAAIVARELKKPCVVGTKIATRVLQDGDMIEVDATKGIVKK